MSVDMSRSGWDNPEGFTPRQRDQAPPPEPACEVAGPDGWVCDLPPRHGGTDHHADGGPSWPIEGKQRPEPALLSERWAGEPAPWPGRMGRAVVPPSEADRTVLAKVREVAQKGQEDHYPAAWAVALAKIVRLTDGY
jgi:hypothetical protein